LSVDTLGLVLRVFVTAASVPERGRQTSPQTGQTHGQITLPLNHYLGRRRLWWRTLPDVGDGRLPLIVQVVLRPEQTKGFVLLKNGGWSSAPSVG